MKTALSVFFLILILGSACSSSNQNRGVLRTGPEYPEWTGPVAVYFEAPGPGIEYEQVGIVNAYGPATIPYETFIADLQVKAAYLGGNAVIIENSSTSTSGVMAHGMGYTTARLTVVGTAIRIK